MNGTAPLHTGALVPGEYRLGASHASTAFSLLRHRKDFAKYLGILSPLIPLTRY